jgi:hypothetical protein
MLIYLLPRKLIPFNRFAVYSDDNTVHASCRPFQAPFQLRLSRRLYITYKVSYPAAWNWCLVETQTQLTTVVRLFFFVSFQNLSCEISLQIPPKRLWNDSCSGGISSATKFRRADISCQFIRVTAVIRLKHKLQNALFWVITAASSGNSLPTFRGKLSI